MNGPTLFDTVSTCPIVREMGHHLRVNTALGSDSEAFRCAGCFFAVCFECGVQEVDLWGTACPSCEEFITESRRWMAEWDRLGLFDMEVHSSQPKSRRGQVAELVATYARRTGKSRREVYIEVNRAVGEWSVKDSSAEKLQMRVDLLSGWLSETTQGDEP